MKFPKALVLLFILSFTSGFGQSLEDTLYSALDHFIEKPTLSSLQLLEEQEVLYSKIAKSPDEHLALVVLNSNMGYYYRQFGNNQKAIYHYERALKRFREKKLDGYDIIEYCLKPLGNLYTITGDLASAENTIVGYIESAKEQNNTPLIIAGTINLSVVYHNTGKHTTAIKLLREGLSIEGISSQQKTALENNLTTNLIALEKYGEAQSVLNQNSQPQYHVLQLRNAAQLAVRDKDFDTALTLLGNAEMRLFENNPLARDVARFYVEKAQVYTLKEDKEKALQNYQKALHYLVPNTNPSEFPRQELLYAEYTFTAVFDGLAQLQEAPFEALRYYDLSFYVSGLLQEQYTAQEVKIIHQAALKKRTEACIEILFDHYQKTRDFSALSRAFAYAEKSKATVLRDMVFQRSLLELHPEDTLLQKRKRLSALQEQKINTLLREQFTNANPEMLNEINENLVTISMTLKGLQEKINQKYPDAFSIIGSMESIQTKVKEDHAILIAYFFGKRGLYRFEISDNGIQLHKTTVDETLNQQIVGFINYFENSSAINNDVLGFKEQALSLFEILLPETLQKNKNLILIPDGLLHFVPFEALLTEPSQSTSYASMPFLVKQNNVSYNTSATLYHNAKTPDLKSSVLGVFPVFEDSSHTLTHSLDEAKNLNRLMESRLLMHQEAGKENFIALAKAHSILHLSTHAHSGNFTIPATMEFYDDVMLLPELYSLHLNPKLVVLSACETGVGKIISGEGAMSLARGFQYAGANNLLFSLWKVNDNATAQLMSSFYEHYSTKNSAFLANRHSKLEYLENTEISNAKKSPYYWSGFVYYGALDKASNPKNSILFYGILFLALGSLLIIFKRKIKKLF